MRDNSLRWTHEVNEPFSRADIGSPSEDRSQRTRARRSLPNKQPSTSMAGRSYRTSEFLTAEMHCESCQRLQYERGFSMSLRGGRLMGEDRARMSIATQTGDGGSTALTGGTRVSKADLRVEAYGTVDELNATLGLARSLCSDEEIRTWTEAIQRTLFRVGAALSRPADQREASGLTAEDVDTLTAQVHAIEVIDGILADWSLPGAHRESAAFEVARTVCRRAERCAVRLGEAGGEVLPEVIRYLNRLSDLLWLFGRLIEHRAGIDARLRADGSPGPGWSRAW